MSTYTRRNAILGGMAAAALTVTAAFGQSSAEQNLTGSYASNGLNSDGTPYQGTAAIVEKDNEITLTWSIGGQTYQGQGVRQGLVVVIDWGSTHPIVYVVMPNGNLHGTWDDGRALDKLTKL